MVLRRCESMSGKRKLATVKGEGRDKVLKKMEMSWSYTEWHADFEGSTTKHHLVSLCRNRIFRSKEEQHLRLPLVLSLQ